MLIQPAIYSLESDIMAFPKELEADISLATKILLAEGCKEIYLFGSIAKGSFSKTSDIDIATIGLSKEKFFRAYGTLLSKLRRHIDLVGLDYDTDFGRQLKETGALTRVA
jgi:predicted nucleotidyltransferase